MLCMQTLLRVLRTQRTLLSVLCPFRHLRIGSERRFVFACSDPVFLLFPSPAEGAALLKDAEAKSKRVKKKR